jgi:hypothetical protein
MKWKILVVLLFLINVNLFAGGTQRFVEHIEFKKRSLSLTSVFDTVEICAYLTPINHPSYAHLPDTVAYDMFINGQKITTTDKYQIVITEPCIITFGYIDYPDLGGTPYLGYIRNYAFYGKEFNNINYPFSVQNSNVFYTKPNYKVETRFNWNQIKVWLKFAGIDPKPNENYCFGSELKHGLRDFNYYHIDHVNWYNNGVLLNHQDSLFTIVEPGNYYAEIVSNFGYKYYSDTIKISTYQFAKYTDCIDAQIEANNESKITGKKGFEDVINKKLNIYPNPVIDFIELNFKTCNEVNANFELYNVSGIRLIQKMFHFNKDENSQVQLDLTGVSPGLYVLCFDFNGIKKRTKIIKQ